MLTTILALIGWLLFLATAVLYWIGNRLNSKENNSLAMYSLALIFSDKFRTGIQTGFKKSVMEACEQSLKTQNIIFDLMNAITLSAEKYYVPQSDINTFSIVTNAIEKDIFPMVAHLQDKYHTSQSSITSAAAPSDVLVGTTIRNPNTGERRVFDGTTWKPIQ
ncbi:MAG TPA: hypothetical protein VFE58_07565 [Tepidisphaeraceae bacterium]|jgi:hypothetical protein|nr:hypothetical protein [Tepidisphaeraceae bacterium]